MSIKRLGRHSSSIVDFRRQPSEAWELFARLRLPNASGVSKCCGAVLYRSVDLAITKATDRDESTFRPFTIIELLPSAETGIVIVGRPASAHIDERWALQLSVGLKPFHFLAAAPIIQRYKEQTNL
jgi:hypothetical protein